MHLDEAYQIIYGSPLFPLTLRLIRSDFHPFWKASLFIFSLISDILIRLFLIYCVVFYYLLLIGSILAIFSGDWDNK